MFQKTVEVTFLAAEDRLAGSGDLGILIDEPCFLYPFFDDLGTVGTDIGIQKLEQSGFSAPPAASVSQFKSSVLAKVSCLQRYLSERTSWHEDLERVYRLMEMNASDIDLSLLRKLDSARAGYDVLLDDLVLPESINKRVVSLLEKNRNLHNVWNQFDNDKTLSVSDELLHFFQMEYVKEISLSAKVPLAFYFLSLVLLLATFFFIFKSNKD